MKTDIVGDIVRDCDVVGGYEQARSMEARALRLWPEREWLHDTLVSFAARNPILTSNFVVVDPDRRHLIINQSYANVDTIFNNRFVIEDGRFSIQTDPIFLGGEYIILGGPIDGVWYHWLFNWCPRLLVLQSLRPDLLASRDVRILVHPSALQEPFRSLLDTFGIPPERLVAIDPTRDYTIETAHLVSFLDQQKLYPEQIRSFADHLLRAWNISHEPEQPGVFASRQALAPPKRRIQNFDDIEPVFGRFALQVVDCGTLSAREQARIFRAARVVVGGHGSDLANLLFCRPGTRVLVLESAWSVERRAHVGLKYLCEILDLRYQVLITANAGEKPLPDAHAVTHVNRDYIVDPEELSRELHALVSA